MNRLDILKALARLGEELQWSGPVEILLVGGAAGMLTGLLTETRVTQDCDFIRCDPQEAQSALGAASAKVTAELGLERDWFSGQVQQLDVLSDGWRNRRKLIGEFGVLRVYAVGRLDLLAMKFYSNRMNDREDIKAMGPTAEELAFVRTYLNMLRVPRRQANLDQVQSGLRLVDLFEKGGIDGWRS